MAEPGLSPARPRGLRSSLRASPRAPSSSGRHAPWTTCRSQAASTTASGATVLQELAAGRERKYVMISGKGGVGKTSLSSSLAVRLAQEGHTVLVVSIDPAHSLGDSLEQDLSGGRPVPLEGTDLPIWGMEIDPEMAKAELRREWEKKETQEKASGPPPRGPAAGAPLPPGGRRARGTPPTHSPPRTGPDRPRPRPRPPRRWRTGRCRWACRGSWSS